MRIPISPPFDSFCDIINIIGGDIKKFLFWAPRILGILFIAFLTLFSLDVFGQGTIWYQIIGFIIHSIPSIILLIILIIAWRRPKIGGIIFLILAAISAILYPMMMWERFGLFTLVLLLILDGPIVLTGILFLLDNKINFHQGEK